MKLGILAERSQSWLLVVCLSWWPVRCKVDGWLGPELECVERIRSGGNSRLCVY